MTAAAFNAARPRIDVTEHPNGMPHIRDTIAKMFHWATEDSQSLPIRQLATRITHNVPSKDVRGELAALYRWVRDNIRYRFDPHGIEWLQRPLRTLQEKAGDCDDFAMLLAALAGSLGHRWDFITVGPTATTPEHVAARAWDGKLWVTLDPVLEPMQLSTAPRADNGRFGATAPGYQITWKAGGNMLGGQASAADRELWDWCPYYPPVPPTFNAHSWLPGAYTTPDVRYRSGNAPGYIDGKSVRLVFSRGSVDKRAADAQGRIPYTHNGQPGFLFLGSFWDDVADVASVVIPGVAAARAVVKVAQGKPLSVNQVVGALSFGGPLAGKAFIAVADKFYPGSGALLEHGAAILSDLTKKHPKGHPGFTLKEFLVAIPAAAKLAGMGDVVKIAQSSGVVDVGTAVEIAKSLKLPKTADALHSLVTHAVAATGLQPAHGADTRKPHPSVGKKYGAGARQVQRNGLFFVYKPAAGLHGFKPTLTLSLGAAAATPVQYALPTANEIQLAKDMVKALDAYIAAHGKPFYGKGVRTRAFQTGVRGLTVDGEYGPNVRAAGAWALGVPESKMPAVDPRYANYARTWQPPRLSAVQQLPPPAPAHRPAPKPSGGGTLTIPKGGYGPIAAAAAQQSTPLALAPNVPGYTPIGTEVVNPGLPPAGGNAPPPAPSTSAARTAPTRKAGTAVVARGKPGAHKPAVRKPAAGAPSAAHAAAVMPGAPPPKWPAPAFPNDPTSQPSTLPSPASSDGSSGGGGASSSDGNWKWWLAFYALYRSEQTGGRSFL